MAKKFLDDVELGSDSIRAAVVEFMPYSFAAVNAQSKRFLEVTLNIQYIVLLRSVRPHPQQHHYILPCAGSNPSFNAIRVSMFTVCSQCQQMPMCSVFAGGEALQLHNPQDLPGADQAVQECAGA